MRLWLLTGVLLATSGVSSSLTVVNFNVAGDATLPSFSQSGMTVTGSGELKFWTVFSGTFGNVGIVGGQSDQLADNGEYLDFDFGQPVVDLGYSVMASSSSDGMAMVTGVRAVSVFGGAGTLLGEYFDQGNALLFSVSSRFPQPITRMRLTAQPQMGFAVSLVQFTPAPEPSMLALCGAALLGLRACMRRRVS